MFVKRSVSALAIVVTFMFSGAARAQTVSGPPPGTKPPKGEVVTAATCGSELANNLYRLCFDGKAWKIDEPSNSRFTNRDRVEVEIQRFNFIRYTLSFDVKEEKSESYQYLTKLWTSVLSPDLLGLVGLGLDADKTAAEAAALVTAMRDLNRRTEALDRRIAGLVGVFTKTGLTTGEASALDMALGTASPCTDAPDNQVDQPAWISGPDPLRGQSVRALVCGAQVSLARLQRQVLMTDGGFTAAYGKQSKLYTMVTEAVTGSLTRADAFVTRAVKTTGSEVKKLGKHDAGTRVTLSVAAIGDGGDRTPLGDVNYFVETTIPLVAHGGLAFSGLKDVTFQKVQRASAFGEDDLFQKVSDGNNTTGFCLFLSWMAFQLDRHQTPNKSVAAILLSLGTDVAKPGKRIFAGPSLMLFNRLVLTAGLAFGKEASGEQQTLAPDIFQVVKERPRPSGFFALTMKVH
jgi:hypothetical protein